MEGGCFEGPNGRDPISEMLKKKSEQSQPWAASGSPAAASDHTGAAAPPCESCAVARTSKNLYFCLLLPRSFSK